MQIIAFLLKLFEINNRTIISNDINICYVHVEFLIKIEFCLVNIIRLNRYIANVICHNVQIITFLSKLHEINNRTIILELLIQREFFSRDCSYI